MTSQPVYLLTVLKAIDEVLEDIDKIRKKILWAGDKAIQVRRARSIGPDQLYPNSAEA
jgi:hypothetical protein